ncbi:hypothetical protein KC19_1G023700 [Ceratodon purpureus]|uniref:Protein kinase domain-containing protein n=1 Tax=Ceratodon purpureus TaxID=3225 RepID=A0A8T0J3I2_CERPU|nr:hypothetical protein KC19_1G023700 [Ceratodon purpureus]
MEQFLNYVVSIAGQEFTRQREDFIRKVMSVIESADFILQGERFLNSREETVDSVEEIATLRETAARAGTVEEAAGRNLGEEVVISNEQAAISEEKTAVSAEEIVRNKNAADQAEGTTQTEDDPMDWQVLQRIQPQFSASSSSDVPGRLYTIHSPLHVPGSAMELVSMDLSNTKPKGKEIVHDDNDIEMQKPSSRGNRSLSTRIQVSPVDIAEHESRSHPAGLIETETEIPGNEFDLGSVESLDSYLTYVAECMEAVHKMKSWKFNKEQCQYLADKLQMGLESARLFLNAALQGEHNRLSSSEDMTRYTEIFKLLVALAKEILSFSQGCCKENWIQTAMTLTNASKHASLIGFKLELCRVGLGKECSPGGCLLTLKQFASIVKGEAELVEKMASLDLDKLLAKVMNRLTENSLSSQENDLATCLLQRLNKVKTIPLSSSSRSPWSILKAGLQDLYEWVKPIKRLGKGASGVVYEAMWLGIQVAKKTFPGAENPDFKKEAEILGGLCHPNITSMFCCAVENKSCSIVMELMEKDLNDLMQDRCNTRANNNSDCSPFTIFEAVDIMIQVAEGVNYLHNEGPPLIVHRDLKSSNILVKCIIDCESQIGYEIGYVQAKITDFGLSKTKDRSIRYSQQSPNTGTSKWMAPEIIRLDASYQESTSRNEEVPSYPKKGDVYSFGMVCYEILTGDEPFPNELARNVKKKVLNGERPNLPDHCPLELKVLIQECWDQDPTARPSFDVICLKLKHVMYSLIMGFV